MTKDNIHIEGLFYIPPDTFIKNPLIHIQNGMITKIESSNASPFHEKGCAIPAVVNAHSHLDFSTPIYATNFISWIEKIILETNSARGYHKKTIENLNKYLKTGILYYLDITRDLEYPIKSEHIMPFYEIIGDENRFLPDLPDRFMVSLHAPYSVSPELMVKAKKRYKGKLFMIHIAENFEEIKFLKGERNLIEERIYPLVKRKKSFKETFRSSIDFLEKLSLLDEKSILVHCIEVDEKDIKTISKYKANVVVCPRSNLYLSGKIADIPKFLEEDINVALGTDGLGSTPNLNMWEEARTLYLYFRGKKKISPQTILKMLTLNGLKILKKEKEASFIVLNTTEKRENLAFEILYQAEEIIKSVYFKGKRANSLSHFNNS